MLFRFTGEYTNGHTAINACGVVFQGREPADVTEPDGIRRLSGHPEFVMVQHIAPGVHKFSATIDLTMPPSIEDAPEGAFEAEWGKAMAAIKPVKRRAKKAQ